jgi:hypothetical protein
MIKGDPIGSESCWNAALLSRLKVKGRLIGYWTPFMHLLSS